MEESIVVKVALEGREAEPSGLDLTYLESGFRSRGPDRRGKWAQPLSGICSRTEKSNGVEWPAPSTPMVGGTSEVTEARRRNVIGEPLVLAAVRVVWPEWRGFEASGLEEPDAKTPFPTGRVSTRCPPVPRRRPRHRRKAPAVSTGIVKRSIDFPWGRWKVCSYDHFAASRDGAGGFLRLGGNGTSCRTFPRWRRSPTARATRSVRPDSPSTRGESMRRSRKSNRREEPARTRRCRHP